MSRPTHRLVVGGLSAVRLSALGGAVALALLAVPVAAHPGLHDESTGVPALTLASSFVDTLNAGDVEAVVALFDDEGTVFADRHAWLKYEVRLWAQTQTDNSIKMVPESPFRQEE